MVAVLLPLTSRGNTQESLLKSLSDLELCLPAVDSCVLLIGIDDDDALLTGDAGRALLAQAFSALLDRDRLLIRFFEPTMPVQLCRMVAALGREAYGLGGDRRCDYFVLLGDDVRIEPKRSWIANIRRGFTQIHTRINARFRMLRLDASAQTLPWGFGVMALADLTFPGFPTFPVVGRAHLDAFEGDLWPSLFINQDADPFLWALYRSFDARMFATDTQLRNLTGGDEHNPARYERHHVDWKADLLWDHVYKLQQWLAARLIPEDPVLGLLHIRDRSLVTLDVITPSFRCDRALLFGILALPQPADASINFIVIVDDPKQQMIRLELERLMSCTINLTVRVNGTNKGASASRNVGIEESSGDWNLFLDDDIQPHPWLLYAYVDAIWQNGTRVAGFAGLSCLPPPCTWLTAGLHLSHLTYFWRIAELTPRDEVGWAVTANVCVRRTGVRFDLDFLKTGGGEDILFLRRTVAYLKLPLLKCSNASITHPWWDRAHPSPWRFYRWAASDSLLMEPDKLPRYAFYSAPHAVEMSALLIAFGLPLAAICYSNPMLGFQRVLVAISCLWLAEFIIGACRRCHDGGLNSVSLNGWRWLFCSAIATVYVTFCEFGHTWAPLRRGSWYLFCKRVDWWYGLNPQYQRDKQLRESIDAAIFIAAITIGLLLSGWTAAVTVGMLILLILLLILVFQWPSSTNPIDHHNQQQNGSIETSATAAATLPTHLALISDNAYAPALAVSVRSLLDHHNVAVPLEVHIVDVGLGDDMWNAISNMQTRSV